MTITKNSLVEVIHNEVGLNKREAKEYKKFYAFPWDEVPVWFILLVIIGLLFLVFY